MSYFIVHHRVVLLSITLLCLLHLTLSDRSLSHDSQVDPGCLTSLCLTGWIQYVLLPCVSQAGSRMSYFPVYHKLDPVCLTSLCITGWIQYVLLPCVSQGGSSMSYFPVYHKLNPGCLTSLCCLTPLCIKG